MKQGNNQGWGIDNSDLLEKVVEMSKKFENVKEFILPEKQDGLQVLKDESEYFKQQLYNEVRRCVMLDYMNSRESFIDVGEQYTRHAQSSIEKWNTFIKYYHDSNN